MRRSFEVLLVLLAAVFGLAGPLAAHDTRPAYLEIRALGGGKYDARLVLAVVGRVATVEVTWPDGVREDLPTTRREIGDTIVSFMHLDAGPEGLDGRTVRFRGLGVGATEVLVRLILDDRHTRTFFVRAAEPSFSFNAPLDRMGTAIAYLRLGVEHILFGADHLVFVFGLFLLVKARRLLVWTVTAFTLAHSLTLGAATLGIVHVPPPPLEAAIALSILCLGQEILHARAGRPSLIARAPWLVAFLFGLFHGFGFAGALSEVGLPEEEIPTALVTFNLGVECGQLAFIGVVALGARLLNRAWMRRPEIVNALPGYAVGTLGAFWSIERVVAVLGG